MTGASSQVKSPEASPEAAAGSESTARSVGRLVYRRRIDAKLAIAADPAQLPEARAFVDSAAARAGFNGAARYQITMAANEAISNAIEHGAPCPGGRILLAAGASRDALTLSVRDCGRFAEGGTLTADSIAERGRGFAFMNLLMDDVRLESEPGQTVISLVKRLPGAPLAPAGASGHAGDANESLRVVERLLDGFTRRDVTTLLDVADRGVMFEPLSTPVGRRTPYLGHAGLRRYLRDLEETWDELRITIDELRPRADYVLARGSIHGAAGDFAADEPAFFVWRVRAGRAVWGKVFRSEEDALRAAGFPGQSAAA